MNAYKFSETAAEQKPNNADTCLLEKAQDGARLDRTEKNRVAQILWGLFGAQSNTYRLAGWAWPMYSALPRFLVGWTYGGWQAYHAPDKTSLRKVLHCVREIVSAPKGVIA